MRAPGQVDDHDESNCIECCEESLKPGNAAPQLSNFWILIAKCFVKPSFLN
jgi:hypothetical protein